MIHCMFSDDLFYQKNTFKCPSKISQAVIYQYVIPFQYMGVITSAISGRVTSRKANYLPSYVPKIIELVNCYHDYDKPKNKLLQLLMEVEPIIQRYGRFYLFPFRFPFCSKEKNVFMRWKIYDTSEVRIR